MSGNLCVYRLNIFKAQNQSLNMAFLKNVKTYLTKRTEPKMLRLVLLTEALTS